MSTSIEKTGLLPECWRTARLEFHDSTLEETPRLREVFNACAYVGKWDPTFVVEDEAAFTLLVLRSQETRRDVRIGFQMQSLKVQATGEIIGYFHVYLSTPHPHTVWISMFVLHPDCQNKGYARETVQGLSEALHSAGYAAIWLQVYLKNWPALRFWISAGFRGIMEYRGDEIMSEHAAARLVLEKRLDRHDQNAGADYE